MDSSYEYQKQIESGDRVVVGMNKFKIQEASPKGLLRVDPVVGQLQKQKIKELQEERDNAAVAEKLASLKEAAEGTSNLMPFILDAVRAYATLGEICGVLRDVFGEYQQSVII